MSLRISWSLLKRSTGSKIAKASVFAPILGWILIADGSFQQFLANYFKYPNLSIPSLNLYLLYMGLFSYGIAVLLYSLFCPIEISEFSSKTHYVDEKIKNITKIDVTDITAILKDSRFKNESDNLVSRIDFDAEQLDRVVTHEQFVRNNKKIIIELISYFYKDADERFWVIRLLVAILVFLGGILTAIPACRTFLEVAKKLFINSW